MGDYFGTSQLAATGQERLVARQREALRQADHLFQTLLHQTFTEGL